VRASHSPITSSSFRDRSEACDAAASSPNSYETKVPLAVLAQALRRPGPKGPGKELIEAFVEVKRRNPSWGCPRIVHPIALAFGIDIDKDMVRRI
jgi:hypothetical protein